MIDPSKRQTAGTRPKLSARAWNQFVDTANLVQLDSTGKPGGRGAVTAVSPSHTAMIVNDTGAARNPGDIVSVPLSTAALATFPTDPLTTNRRPYLTGTVPDSADNFVAVYVDSVDDEEIGKAVFGGLVCCFVNITDAGHKFATATTGDCSKLTSAASGPIRIMKAAAGTGLKQAMVHLGDARGSSGTARSYVRIIDVDDYGSGYGLDRTRTFTARPVTFLADGGVLDVDAGGGLDFLIGEEDEHNLIVGDDHAYPVEADSSGFQRINIGPLASYDAGQPRYTPGIMGVGQKQYFRGVKIFGDYGGTATDNQQGNVWSQAICWLGSNFATADDITSCNGWASVAQAEDSGGGFPENTLTFFVANLNPDVTVTNGDESTGGAGGVPGMGGVQFVQYPDYGNEYVAIRFGVSEIRSSTSFGEMKFQSSGYSFLPGGGIHTGYVDFAVANLFVWSDASTQHTGWSGTFTAATKTVTVVHGLITNVA